jgi:hypothetical protein
MPFLASVESLNRPSQTVATCQDFANVRETTPVCHSDRDDHDHGVLPIKSSELFLSKSACLQGSMTSEAGSTLIQRKTAPNLEVPVSSQAAVAREATAAAIHIDAEGLLLCLVSQARPIRS